MSGYWLSVNGTALTNSGYGLGVPDPYNPLNLPPYTFRCQFVPGFVPEYSGCTYTQVSSSPNVWDITKVDNPTDMRELFWENSSAISPRLWKVLGANMTGVTNMQAIFEGCEILDEVCLFDTRSVTDMSYFACMASQLNMIPEFPTGSVTNFSHAFSNIQNLTRVPMLDLTSAQNMDYTFSDTQFVEGGALDLYNVAAARMPAIANHTHTFEDCGWMTTTGRAELEQIPSDWK